MLSAASAGLPGGGRRLPPAAALVWFALPALLLVGLNPRHPLLFGLRALESPLLLGLGLAAALSVGGRAWRSGRWLVGWPLPLLLGLMALVLANELGFRRQRAEVLAAPREARALGGRFIVGYTAAGEVAALAGRGLIAGVYINRRNVAGRPLAALQAEIAHWQALRRAAGLPPLIIAADQEGGSVAHLSPPLPPLPALSSLPATGPDSTLAARATAYGEAQGRALAGLGINLNFAPVVDLRPVRGPLIDLNTRIAERAIAADPAQVVRIAGAYASGLRRAGVMPTFKHFPGLGSVAADTHHFAARLDTPVGQLAAADWLPFRQLGGEGTAIMLGHVVVPELDPLRPASLSPAVVQLLRRQWGFRGLLVSDDLNMGAVYRLGICPATLAALEAGVDLLLIAYDPEQFYRAMHCAMRRPPGADGNKVAELPAGALLTAAKGHELG